MPTLTVDGQSVTVPSDANLLQAVRLAGIHLPTLCHWDGLPPYGACRLCMVEIRRAPEPDKAAPGQTVAACTYPAEDDLVVETNAPAAASVRKLMLEFLLARCPTSAVIRDLVAEAGVSAARFPTDGKPDELCVVCGLCVRVCRDLVGAAAIGFTGRGADREVGSPFHMQSDACIGCGACAAVCPTGAVQIEDVDGERCLSVWNTTVPLKPCPGCGRPFAPEPMTFLAGLVDASEHLWGVCPACRRRGAAMAVTAPAQPIPAR